MPLCCLTALRYSGGSDLAFRLAPCDVQQKFNRPILPDATFAYFCYACYDRNVPTKLVRGLLMPIPITPPQIK